MSINEIKSKLSDDFINKLYDIYSPIMVDEILRSYIKGRKTTLRINSIKASNNEIASELRRNGIKFSSCNYYKDAFVLSNTKESEISKLSCYIEGKIYLQNLSSMLPPLFLELNEGEKILDMCAAPGGKTTEMAAIIHNRGRIIANEINNIRRERLKYNVEKQHASCVEIIGEDGTELGDIFNEKFDKVLLDAPCSGEGTINMDKKESYNGWSEAIVCKNSKLQKKLLQSGINALKKGGTLIYSTCTISPEENEEVINNVLNKNLNVKIMELNLCLKNSINGIVNYKEKKYNENLKKALRILPSGDMEGFFLCKMKKK